MDRSSLTRTFSALLLICALFLGLLPGTAGAAVTWENVGQSLWLNTGEGLDLLTGGAGDDLLLESSTTISAKGGMVVSGASSLSSRLLPPASGYSTSLNISAVEGKVLVVKLDGGRYAQVEIGMGWRSGMGYSSLQIEGWSISSAAEPEPKPEPKPEPEPKPGEASASGGIFWGNYAQKGQLTLGQGLDLETGGAGNDLHMTSDKISAPKGLALVASGSTHADDLSTLAFTDSIALKQVEGKELLVRFGKERYAWVTIDMLWRGGGGYNGVDLHWTLGLPMGLPESQLTAPPYKTGKSPVADKLTTITPGLVGSLASRTAIWTGTYAYAWTRGGTYRFDPATGKLSGLEFSTDYTYGLDAAASVWTGTYAYTIYSPVSGDAYIVQYDPSANKAEVKGASLPNAYYSTAIWNGTYMYIFGVQDKEKGSTDPDRNRLILRYDPATDRLKQMTATMPATTAYDTPFLSAAWDGRYAYLFGADTGAILRYDPASDAIKQMGAVLPGKLDGASAFYDGKSIYLVGGQAEYSSTRAIYQYNPQTDKITAMKTTLPAAQMNAAVVWVGDSAYLFGGWNWTTGHRDVLRYTTGNVDQSMVPVRKQAEGGATELTAVRKGSKAELTWPAFETPNDGYYVFRGTAPGKYDAAPLHDFPVLTGSFTDQTIKDGLAYYYVVKAYKGGKYVAISEEVRLGDEKPKPGETTPKQP